MMLPTAILVVVIVAMSAIASASDAPSTSPTPVGEHVLTLEASAVLVDTAQCGSHLTCATTFADRTDDLCCPMLDFVTYHECCNNTEAPTRARQDFAELCFALHFTASHSFAIF